MRYRPGVDVLGNRIPGVAGLLLTAVVATVPALSQPSVDFNGYVVNFLMVDRLQSKLAEWWGVDRQQIVNLTRVRLRPTLYLWGDARLALEYEADGFRFSSALPYFEVPESRPRQVLDLSWEPVNEGHLRLFHFVDRLYYRQDFGFGNLTVGRQRISWGTGRIWNPTDFFNPVNPAAFYKLEKDGADAVSFKWYLGDFSDLQLVVNPEERWQRNNLAARLRLNWLGVDYAFVVGRIGRHLVGGGDFAGSLAGAGVRGEVALVQDENLGSGRFWKAVFGMDYQFSPLLYGLFEYHYNGQGTRDESRYGLLFPQLLRGEILNLACNYLFVQSSYQLHPLVLVSAAHNWNLDDHSGFWMLSATVSTSDNTALTFGGQIFHGPVGSEYWYFPSAVYAKGEWYF